MTIDKEFKNSEEFQRLQNTVPAGSYGISEQGRRDAINNRVEAQTGMGPGQGTAITTEGSDEALMNRSIWHAEQTGIPSGADLYAGSFSISEEGKKQAAKNRAEFQANKEKRKPIRENYTQCTYYQLQTRSADEPMTTFVTCIKCGTRFKC